MYTKLHAHGVLHADVGWRHILRVPEAPARSRGSSTSTSDGTSSGAPGQDSKANADSDAPTPTPTRRALRLVSFDRAIMRHTETPEEWAAKCVSEMQRVEALLELHPIAAGWPRKMERAATPVLSAPATPKRTPASKNVSPAARLVHSNAHAYAANTSANASPKPRGLFRRRQLKRGSTPIPKKYESDTDSSDELKPPARLNIIQRLITPKSSVASLRAVAVKQEVDTHGHAHVHAYEHARSHSGSPSRIYTGPRQLAVGEHGLRHRVSQFFGLHTT
jgi:hypothetical protein